MSCSIGVCVSLTWWHRELNSRQSDATSKEYFFGIEWPQGLEVAGFELFQEPFNYLHAERIGPRKAFQIPPDEGHPLRVGRYGESAPFIIASDRRNTRVTNDAVLIESSDGKVYSTLQYQWPLWMARLFPGLKACLKSTGRPTKCGWDSDCSENKQASGLFVRPTIPASEYRLCSVLSWPGWSHNPMQCLLWRIRRAHLHPRAQSGIGEFLARVAAGGAQVLVETHSEHVLNGMRRMVSQTVLSPDQIRVHYFANSEASMEPAVETLPVLRAAISRSRPEGFCDQLDHDLSIILG